MHTCISMLRLDEALQYSVAYLIIFCLLRFMVVFHLILNLNVVLLFFFIYRTSAFLAILLAKFVLYVMALSHCFWQLSIREDFLLFLFYIDSEVNGKFNEGKAM